MREQTLLFAETASSAIVAVENRACCSGLRISMFAMEMLFPRDLHPRTVTHPLHGLAAGAAEESSVEGRCFE